MAPEQTQRVMGDYFAAMGKGEFTQFFTDDVTWTTVDVGAEVRGAPEVQEAILALHSRMSDMRTRQLVFSDNAAYLEGDCAALDGGQGRIPYCVAYDLVGPRIRSMRAYGALGAFMPS